MKRTFKIYEPFSSTRVIQSCVDTKSKRYLQKLENLVIQKVEDEVDSISFTEKRHELSIVVTWMDEYIQFDIPYSELSFQLNKMDIDVSYVANSVIDEIEHSIDER